MKDERRSQILKISRDLFLHHGFQKVTLSDIAEEVGVSRPTLYQVFSNKEEIFRNLIQDWQGEALQRIRDTHNPGASAELQLNAAIEIWIIEPFELMQGSPRASELQECTFGFAAETVDEGYVKFEGVVGEILASEKRRVTVRAEGLAHFIVTALRGFKTQAKDVKELRRLIETLMALVFK